MRRLVALLSPCLAAGGGLGALLAAFLHRHLWVEGFPLLLADEVRQGLLHGLALAALFALLFVALEAVSRRFRPLSRLPAGLAPLGVTGLALAPAFAVVGYRANRAWGLRPADLLAPYGLQRNLALLALMVAALLAAWLLLARFLPPASKEGRGRLPWRSLGAIILLALGLHFGVTAAFRSRAAGTPETPVLLLLVDALRADHLGSYGYGRPTSPAIDSLAADGVLFRQAIAPSTFTKASIASLFTGRYPFQHGVYQGSTRESPETFTSDLLGEGETTLAELLRTRGYLTAGWVQNSHLRSFMGFAQGFVAYRDQFGGIRRIHRHLFPWLAGPGRRYGFFAYLHYIDLHDPYRPWPPYDRLFASGRDPYAGIDLAAWGAHLEAVRRGEIVPSPEQIEEQQALYDGLIRAVDDEIGRLLQHLKELDLYDRSLIVLTADHGDAFYEHGFLSHSTTPYEELVRVPLIFKLPGQRARGEVISEQVSLVDVLPTVAEVVGKELSPKRPLAGCSLLPLIEGGAAGRPPACARAVIEIAEDGAYPILALRTGEWKYIHHEQREDELYHLAEDPGERTNRIADEPALTADFRRQVDEILTARKLARAERLELDERTLKELKALGYVE